MKVATRLTWIMVVSLLLVCGPADHARTAASPPEKAATPPTKKPPAPLPASAVSAASRPLPDLMVERIWLDGECLVNVQLKNAGPGDIPESEHGRAEIKLFIGDAEEAFSLSRGTGDRRAVDPRGALRKAGGGVSFNTGRILQAGGLVRVWVDDSRRIRETRTENNRSQAGLTPQCRSAQTTAAALKERVAPGPAPAPVPLINTGAQDAASAPTVQGFNGPSGQRSLYDVYKLHVDLDRELFPHVYRGDSLNFTFFIDKRQMAVFDRLTLTLRPGTGAGSTGTETVAELIPESAGHGNAWLSNFRWTVADTIPLGKYRLHASAYMRTYNLLLSWQSGDFNIAARTAPLPLADRIVLRIDHPEAGETVIPGDNTVHVGYYCNVGNVPYPDVPEVSFRFKLLKGGRVLHRYVINFYGRSDFGMAQPFSTVGFVTAPDYEFQIEVFDPSTDEVYKSVSSGLFTIDMTYAR